MTILTPFAEEAYEHEPDFNGIFCSKFFLQIPSLFVCKSWALLTFVICILINAKKKIRGEESQQCRLLATTFFS
jgi:hypothetical protein